MYIIKKGPTSPPQVLLNPQITYKKKKKKKETSNQDIKLHILYQIQ